MKLAVIGAGWAGCAAAVEATRQGHNVTLFEAARSAGGRARRVDAALEGRPLALDNGQHILIGAYTQTLKLMAELGVDLEASLLRLPLTLQFPDGCGLALPVLPAPLDALAGILRARGWSGQDKLSLLKLAAGWRLSRFSCRPEHTVADLCRGLAPRIMRMLIEPLCVSALNTPAARASGQVFLRVLRDALFSGSASSNLLLPRVDLGALMPDAACAWLLRQGGTLKLGVRIKFLSRSGDSWLLQSDRSAGGGREFQGVILACPPSEAARLLQDCALPCQPWIERTRALSYEAISTVYAFAPGSRLRQPMLSLYAGDAAPAQFVFDRGQLGGPPGLLAFVVSASAGDKAALGACVLRQAEVQLGLKGLALIQTIVEKRATFACTPGLQRPGMQVVPGLLACGDYVEGPYPATLEGAVRSGLAAARSLA